ncbi:MAG TPA: copper transporter, partial [Syntrophomonas sp.]|nr:copper transporter [Syntrophomonas sp.]
MIDLRYHIASLVAIFLALGLGVLIGSTMVSDDVMVAQQQKMIDRLEEQFYALRDKENTLVAENEKSKKIIDNYENFSQSILPQLVTGRLVGTQVAVMVTGTEDIPAGMLNAFSLAGANVTSKTVLLPNISMNDANIRNNIIKYYGLDSGANRDVMRQKVAETMGAVLSNQADPEAVEFLEQNNLVKLNGNYNVAVSAVIIVGGANDLTVYFPDSFDRSLINSVAAAGIKAYGTETSQVKYSYMSRLQQNNITTVDNIDLGPGQISVILSMQGEQG